jgi:hypothetical protein
MPRNPLAEVFGYPVNNMSQEARNHRDGRLCPYHNSSGLNCTKNSATDPLGVCTVVTGNKLAITCPVRLRQDLLIVADAARFFFPSGPRYVALIEARLNDKQNKSAGNIDIVIAALDENNRIYDFGAVEVQAVYISGNVSKAFKEYMKDPAAQYAMDWPSKNYPKPDYLSSSRKRLTPQLIYKGGILHRWGKKLAVVVQREFFEELPTLHEVDPEEAEIAWLIYDLILDTTANRYKLIHAGTTYTRFKEALDTITTAEPGDIHSFMRYLNDRVKKGKIMGTPPKSELPPTIEPLSATLEETDSADSQHVREDTHGIQDE